MQRADHVHVYAAHAGGGSIDDRAADYLSDVPNISRSSDEDAEIKPSSAELSSSAPPDRLRQVWDWFAGLRAQQKVYLIAALWIVAWLLPNLVQFGVVGVERMLVGVLIGMEEAVVFVFRRGALALAALGLLVFAAVGVQYFVLDNKQQR